MAEKTKRIILTGAQGTGKTTLMNALTADGTKALSVAREQAIAAGWSSITGTTQDYQKTLFKSLLKAVSSNKSYVSDRGLTCVAAYTFDGAIKGDITKQTADKQYLKLQKFHKENPDILLVYVPIEFELEDDGVRNTDKEYQAQIDFFIKNLLDTAGLKYITVTGTVEERVKQIEDHLATL